MAFADTAKLAVHLSLEGNFQSQIGKAESSLSHLNATIGKTASKIGNDLGKGIRTSAQNIERLTFVAGGLAIGAGAAAVKWAGDFQAQLNTINTIAFATPDALKAIGDGIRNVARTSGQDLGDLTGAYYDLLSAGIKVADAQTILDQAVTLGIGALGTTTETVDLLTTAVNAYGLDAAGSAKATDMFAQAVADGKVKVSEISATFANVASIAKAAGIGIDQIAAAYGDLTAQGVPAAEVTTEMNRAIVELIKPNKDLIDLQKTTKTNFADMAREKGLVVALEAMRVAADKAGVPFQTLFGRLEGYKFALQTTGPAFNNYIAELGRVDDSTGMAAKQAAERQQGFSYQLDRLKANVHDVGITIGNYLLPPLADLSKELADFLAGHQDELKKFGENLGSGVRDAVKWFKSLDWNAIALGLRTAAGFVQSLVGAFGALPTETKGLLLGLYGLNKLSGGAVINIGVDLLKGAGGGLFQQFLGRGSPANPMWVTSVGGLGGGAAGGLGGGLMKVAAAGAITGLALGAVFETQQAISGQSSAQAKDIHSTLTKNLPTASDADLRTQLAAIDTGIEKITSNPLMVLVQGSALDELRSMREDVAKQLQGAGKRADDLALPSTITDQRQGDTRENNRILRQTGQTTASKIDYAKVATTTKIDTTTKAVQTSQNAIVAAIQALAKAMHITIGVANVTTKAALKEAYGTGSTVNRGGMVAS